MAKQVKRRRGTTAQHSSFTGAVGETTVDTSKNTVVVHDGSTAGGFPLALEDLSTTTGTPTFTGVNLGDENLNTYDEGFATNAFTPTVTFGGASVGVTYSVQVGMYGKIGRMVFVSLRVVLTNKGSSVGPARIDDLPFTVANIGGEAIGAFAFGNGGYENINLATNYTMLVCGASGSTTNASINVAGDNVGLISAFDTDFANNSSFHVSGWYIATS